jgi:hypothetical protein
MFGDVSFLQSVRSQEARGIAPTQANPPER